MKILEPNLGLFLKGFGRGREISLPSLVHYESYPLILFEKIKKYIFKNNN